MNVIRNAVTRQADLRDAKACEAKADRTADPKERKELYAQADKLRTPHKP